MKRFASWVRMCPGTMKVQEREKEAARVKGTGRSGNCYVRYQMRHAIIFVFLKKRVAYKYPSIDYEELREKCKAPRWIQTLKKFGYLQHDDLIPAAC